MLICKQIQYTQDTIQIQYNTQYAQSVFYSMKDWMWKMKLTFESPRKERVLWRRTISRKANRSPIRRNAKRRRFKGMWSVAGKSNGRREVEWSPGSRMVTDSKEGEGSPVQRNAKRRREVEASPGSRMVAGKSNGRRFKGMRRVTRKTNGCREVEWSPVRRNAKGRCWA